MQKHRLWKRGRIWWCSYYVGKRRIRESTGCTSRRAAEGYLTKAEERAHHPARTIRETVAGSCGLRLRLGKQAQLLQHLSDAKGDATAHALPSSDTADGAPIGVARDLLGNLDGLRLGQLGNHDCLPWWVASR